MPLAQLDKLKRRGLPILGAVLGKGACMTPSLWSPVIIVESDFGWRAGPQSPNSTLVAFAVDVV